jgi:hypothetical protein
MYKLRSGLIKFGEIFNDYHCFGPHKRLLTAEIKVF